MSAAEPVSSAGPQAAAAADAPDDGATQLQADAFRRLYPEQFFARFAEEGLRPDGRGLSTPRAVTIGLRAVGAADGSALVRVGSTAVLAGVRLEVAVPSDASPDSGSLVVSADVSPLASGDWRPGRPPPPDAHALAARAAGALLAVFDTRQLCIARGAAAWVVYLDLLVLDAAGGVLDAGLLAAVAALRDCWLPAVHLTRAGNVERGPAPPRGGAEDNGSGSEEDSGGGDGDTMDTGGATGGSGGGGGGSGPPGGGRARRLVLSDTPVCLTCGIYRGGAVVVDPDHWEAGLMAATVSIIAGGGGGGSGGGGGGLLGVYKPGGAALIPPRTLLTCVALARARQKEVQAQLEAALQQQGELDRQDGAQQEEPV